MINISVLVTSYRNHKELFQCLKSLSWAEDIHVFSRQEAASIEGASNIKLIRPSEEWLGTPLSWCLEHADFCHEWVLLLAAHERLSEDLLASMEAVLCSPSAYSQPSAWRVRRSLTVGEAYLGHGSSLDAYPVLLRRRAVFASEAHPWAAVSDGRMPLLQGALDAHVLNEHGHSAWLAGLEADTQEEVRHIVQRHRQQVARDWINVFANSAPYPEGLLNEPTLPSCWWRPWLKFFRASLCARQLLRRRPATSWAWLEFVREYYIWSRVQELCRRENLLAQSSSSAHLSLVHPIEDVRCEESAGLERDFHAAGVNSVSPAIKVRA